MTLTNDQTRAAGATPPVAGLLKVYKILEGTGLTYWLDSGTLLGVAREGGELAWDSDIDLGVWADEVPLLQALLPALRKQGFKVGQRRYRGRVFGFTIVGRRPDTFRPVHIHVYFRDHSMAWSPQTVTYQPYRREGVAQGFANWPKLRSMLLRVKYGALRRYEGNLVQRAWRCAVCYPIWGVLVVVRNRLDRRFWGGGLPYSAIHATYTWIVPARYFDRLETREVAGVEFNVPSDLESYLSERYGNWRTPVSDWCYWTDDGCIYPVPPDEFLATGLVPRKKGLVQ